MGPSGRLRLNLGYCPGGPRPVRGQDAAPGIPAAPPGVPSTAVPPARHPRHPAPHASRLSPAAPSAACSSTCPSPRSSSGCPAGFRGLLARRLALTLRRRRRRSRPERRPCCVDVVGVVRGYSSRGGRSRRANCRPRFTAPCCHEPATASGGPYCCSRCCCRCRRRRSYLHHPRRPCRQQPPCRRSRGRPLPGYCRVRHRSCRYQ